jgi:hypothetical protein
VSHLTDVSRPIESELYVGLATRRRLRVNITRNSRGYSFDHTYEIETDDPDLDLAAAMREGLREGDRAAREAIAEAEYTDTHGLPGSDDVDPKPF